MGYNTDNARSFQSQEDSAQELSLQDLDRKFFTHD